MQNQADLSDAGSDESRRLRRIVALGDSLTWGYPGAYKTQGGHGILRRSARAWPAQVSAALKIDVINAGLNGDPLGGMLKRLPREVLIHKPQMVIVSGGSNDAAQGLDLSAMQARATELSDRLREAEVEIVWGIPPTFVPELVQRYWSAADLPEIEQRQDVLDQFRAWLRRWARQQIDFAAALQDAVAPIEVLLPDGIHPSDAAYDLMAAAAIEEIKVS